MNDDQQRERSQRDRVDRHAHEDGRHDHGPREQARIRLARHRRLRVLRAGVPHLDARRPVEHQRAAAFQHRIVGRPLGLERGEHDLGVAEDDRLAGHRAHALHLSAVDEDAVRRVEVDDLDAARAHLDAGVALGDERVGEHEVDARTSASDDRVARSAARRGAPRRGPSAPRARAAGAVEADERARAVSATTAALKPDPIGASPMRESAGSTTGSFEVGGATASVSAPVDTGSPDAAGSFCAMAAATSPTVAVASAVITMSTGPPLARRSPSLSLIPVMLRSTVNRRPPSRTALPTGSSMRSPAPSDRSAPPGSSTTVPFFEARSATQNRPSVTPNSAWVFEMRMLSSVSGTSTAGGALRPRRACDRDIGGRTAEEPPRRRRDRGAVVEAEHERTGGPMARTRRASTPAAAELPVPAAPRCRRRGGGEHGRLPLPEPGRHHGGTRPRRRDEGVLVRAHGRWRATAAPGWRRPAGALASRRACRSARASNGSRPTRTSSAKHPPIRSSQLRPRCSGSQPDDANSTAGPTNGRSTCAAHSTSTRSVIRQKPAGPNPATRDGADAERRLAEGAARAAVQHQLGEAERRQEHLADGDEHEGERDGARGHGADRIARVRDGGQQQRGADDAGEREHAPRRRRRARRPPIVDRPAPGPAPALRRTPGRADRRRRGPGSARRRRRE